MPLKSVRQAVREQGIRPVKRLGQCFLTDSAIMKKIVESAEIQPDDIVVEIGSGPGLMTALLAEKARHVYAVEVDGRLIALLKEQLDDYPNVEVIQRDILKYDFSSATGGSGSGKVKVVGNIPYSISSPILFRLLDQRQSLTMAVLMMQKEVAERLCAAPGSKTYGIPSVLFGLHASISPVWTVSPACFYPQPKVTSAVVKILFPESPLCAVTDHALFSRLVRTAFSRRRKTLFNNLKSLPEQDCDPRELKNLLRGVEIDEQRRAEELSIQEYAAICNALSNSGKKKEYS